MSASMCCTAWKDGLLPIIKGGFKSFGNEKLMKTGAHMKPLGMYSRERHQFGQPLNANQGYRFMLADMAMKVEAAKALVYRCAQYMDSGAKDISKISAMAKCYASDVAMSVTTDAVQALGGYGYMKEYPVEKMMRDAKITQIYEGTNQIQRDVIGRELVKEAAAGLI